MLKFLVNVLCFNSFKSAEISHILFGLYKPTTVKPYTMNFLTNTKQTKYSNHGYTYFRVPYAYFWLSRSYLSSGHCRSCKLRLDIKLDHWMIDWLINWLID